MAVFWKIFPQLIPRKGSVKPSKEPHKRIRNRLLLLYMGTIGTILIVFTLSVYEVVARDRYQQVDSKLQQLAAAGASTLDLLQHEYEELSEHQKYNSYLSGDGEQKVGSISVSQLMGKYRAQSILKIPQKHKMSADTSIQWYDQKKQLMVHEGDLSVESPLPETIPPSGFFREQGEIRSYIVPSYISLPSGDRKKLGYIRASANMDILHAELARLRWGLTIGGSVAFLFALLGSILLVRESLKPILKNLEQLKQFTADASHELRSPLTAIRTSADVMQQHLERIHASDRKKVNAIASASEQMSSLVEDLLLLTRMDNQLDNHPSLQPIPLDEVLEDVVDMKEAIAEHKNIALQSHITNDIWVRGNGKQLQRLAHNLIDNALQYTPAAGTVAVTLKYSQDKAILLVEDTGMGMTPTQQKHVFDRFWRADKARTRREGGSGLGLSIVKAIVTCHQGSISVTSELGKGSCFQVQLPAIPHPSK